VSDKAQGTVRIKWIRSGIGFTYHQKRIVLSLGLKKVNQEVERPDTPQIRGLVAQVPHLVKIVGAPSRPAWTLVPEYAIYPPKAEPAKPVETPLEAPAAQVEKSEAPIAPPLAPPPEAEAEVGPAENVTTSAEKSGIERHVEILRSTENDSERVPDHRETPPAEAAAETSGDPRPAVSEPANPGGEESGSAGAGPSAGEGQPKD
jgi:large subunit ribosomal protein L30